MLDKIESSTGIYEIDYMTCQSIYVGEMGRKLETRLRNNSPRREISENNHQLAFFDAMVISHRTRLVRDASHLEETVVNHHIALDPVNKAHRTGIVKQRQYSHTPSQNLRIGEADPHNNPEQATESGQAGRHAGINDQTVTTVEHG